MMSEDTSDKPGNNLFANSKLMFSVPGHIPMAVSVLPDVDQRTDTEACKNLGLHMSLSTCSMLSLKADNMQLQDFRGAQLENADRFVSCWTCNRVLIQSLH